MLVKQGSTVSDYAETLSDPSCTHYLSRSTVCQSRIDMCPVQALLLHVVASHEHNNEGVYHLQLASTSSGQNLQGRTIQRASTRPSSGLPATPAEKTGEL